MITTPQPMPQPISHFEAVLDLPELPIWFCNGFLHFPYIYQIQEEIGKEKKGLLEVEAVGKFEQEDVVGIDGK